VFAVPVDLKCRSDSLVATANYMQLLVDVDVTWLCRAVCHFHVFMSLSLSLSHSHGAADYRMFQSEAHTDLPDVSIVMLVSWES